MGLRPTHRDENRFEPAAFTIGLGVERRRPNRLWISRGRLGVWSGMRV
jgi:hypothetical protein